MMKEKKKCVFAGTFDPPTLGHKATVEDSLKLFDEVVIALLVNPQKQPYFTLQQREEMWKLMFPNDKRIRIVTFDGTVTELLKAENTPFYVRGIRNGVDLDFENANYYASKKLDENFVAVYLPCRQELLHVSSSMVRNSLRFSTPIDDYVSEEVKEYIQQMK
ncbi:MAG: pantetheine-phosphate adenylyltransferase [Clostridiales bacterium]|nr:pantetheine-phosphate adenylyltransferase [Clostridiales bacterium]